MQSLGMTVRNTIELLSKTAVYRCPCCHCLTLHERGGYEICPVCFWEDDGQDDHDADEGRGGPNGCRRLDGTPSRQGLGSSVLFASGWQECCCLLDFVGGHCFVGPREQEAGDH